MWIKVDLETWRVYEAEGAQAPFFQAWHLINNPFVYGATRGPTSYLFAVNFLDLESSLMMLPTTAHSQTYNDKG
jgi:hypothetical protein